LKYDYLAFHIDSLIGFQPSFALGRALSHSHWLLIASAFVYEALPLGPVIIFGSYLWLRPTTEAFKALRVLLTAAVAATPIYLLIPASGPVYAFHGFPFRLPADPPWLQAVPIAAPPNAVPSVHFAISLLVAWYARHWVLGKILGLAFVVLMVFGTLGFGQHYAVDLVIAIPYTALIVWKLGNEAAQTDEHV
jgi:hypothetical protein